MNQLTAELIQLREIASTNILFTVGLLLFFGYIMGQLVTKIKLPEITGYIFAGLIMGDTVTGVVHPEMGESLKFVTDLALGLIALTIGGEFYSAKLKSMGKEIIIMTILQVGFAFVFVTLGMLLFGIDLPFALLLGAMATATAPAATVAIVQKLRVHGRFVDYLYGLVALDDAGCVIIFGIVFALVTGMLNPAASGAGFLILHAFEEILFSLVVGGIAGGIIHLMTRKKKGTNEILLITFGVIFIETALASLLNLSPLMANMAAGMVLINASPRNHRIFKSIEPLTPPLYALFFVIAGTELDPAVLMKTEVLATGLVFIIARGLGKYMGVRIGAKVSGLSKGDKNYLGLCMVPQAGVAIGLVLLIQSSPMIKGIAYMYEDAIASMVNIVLLSVFVNEIIGPLLSSFAIKRALEED